MLINIALGIGLIFASALLRSSPKRIYILGRRLSVLQDAASSLDPGSKVVVPLQCDVTDQSSVSKVVEHVEKDVGWVDVLINNAGILGPNHKAIYQADTMDQLQDTLLKDWTEWDTTFRINSSAVIGMTGGFLGLLDAGNIRRGWQGGKVVDGQPRKRNLNAVNWEPEGDAKDERTSQIITVSSIAAFNRYVTAGLAYSASKAAAVHLGKMLSGILAPWGIRSNVVCPGIYPSDMTAGGKTEFRVHEVPAGRPGDAEDLAGVILYLVGKGGAYVNGNVQITDGGRLSMHPATY
ncbi:NAD(P)-binding protein [Patellaria atrata CBS 101060]|uniref:NAD(P)-binding protein n=1 Tax=Patellaria atrata CBS 101060 TaxID=1346257 RepID=A0A9P4S4J3_9PEZI|nr:NAD(P)-binding protein [Patellaria atrata CBS 101060]